MRTIKFRAWDREQRKMFYGDNVQFSGYLGNNINDRGGNWEFLEFTGFLDKHGREIYEGDLVGVPYVNPMGGINDEYDPDSVFPVVFEHGSFSLKRPQFNQELSEWLKKEKGEYIPNFGERTIITANFVGEVVGNIYEGPLSVIQGTVSKEGEK